MKSAAQVGREQVNGKSNNDDHDDRDQKKNGGTTHRGAGYKGAAERLVKGVFR